MCFLKCINITLSGEKDMKKFAQKYLIAILAVAVIITSLLTIVIYKNIENNAAIKQNLVTVPNIEGMTLENAEQALKNVGLTLRTETQFDNNVPEGCVISQEIEANKQINKNSIIYAKISAGEINTSGTTPSNALHFGFVTSQGDWIYFAGNKDSIYRMRKDKSELQRICDSCAVSINVVGEWIYFTDGTAAGGMYKIKTDGSRKTKISSITSYNLYVEGDWIYYSNDYLGGQIYKMKTNGGSIVQLTKDRCSEFIVHNGYIYYINSSNRYVYKCTIDGENNTLFSSRFNVADIAVVDNKIVLANSTKVLGLKLDGSIYSYFDSIYTSFIKINGYDGWIYYLANTNINSNSPKTEFGRMKPDGTQKTTIYEYDYLNHANTYLIVIDGWIYFQNEHMNDVLYRVNIEGTIAEKVE